MTQEQIDKCLQLTAERARLHTLALDVRAENEFVFDADFLSKLKSCQNIGNALEEAVACVIDAEVAKLDQQLASL